MELIASLDQIQLTDKIISMYSWTNFGQSDHADLIPSWAMCTVSGEEILIYHAEPYNCSLTMCVKLGIDFKERSSF